jgi:hypothetical protein
MYVIPFAISMSLIASVLNIIDVIGFIILLLTRVIKLEALYNKFVEPILKICLYLFVFIYNFFLHTCFFCPKSLLSLVGFFDLLTELYLADAL